MRRGGVLVLGGEFVMALTVADFLFFGMIQKEFKKSTLWKLDGIVHYLQKEKEKLVKNSVDYSLNK